MVVILRPTPRQLWQYCYLPLSMVAMLLPTPVNNGNAATYPCQWRQCCHLPLSMVAMLLPTPVNGGNAATYPCQWWQYCYLPLSMVAMLLPTPVNGGNAAVLQVEFSDWAEPQRREDVLTQAPGDHYRISTYFTHYT